MVAVKFVIIRFFPKITENSNLHTTAKFYAFIKLTLLKVLGGFFRLKTS